MDQSDILMTFAELSLALGGFIGIVLVLRSRSDLVVGVPRPLLESVLLVVPSIKPGRSRRGRSAKAVNRAIVSLPACVRSGVRWARHWAR